MVLHGLSMCGHGQARSLAESIGARWLQQLRDHASASPAEVLSVMLGVAGLVGMDPLKGVAWDSASGPTEHMEMVVALAYLLVNILGQVTLAMLCISAANLLCCCLADSAYRGESEPYSIVDLHSDCS